MPQLTFPQYAPDLTPFTGGNTQLIQNGYPRQDGYGPVPAPTVYSAALPGPCRGYTFARNADASVTIFAATGTKLFKLSSTGTTWTDVSKGGGSYTSPLGIDQWQFAQFNNLVIAVQGNTVPQVFDLRTSTAFADLAGSPPSARYIAIVNQFVVLTGLTTTTPVPTPFRIQWSGLDDPVQWTPGLEQSDFQDFPDGGITRGVAGSEFGANVFQEAALRRMIFVGGDVVFQFERISDEKGIFASLSAVPAGDNVFYVGTDGFKRLAQGGYPQPIGKERVDRFFFADVDANHPEYIIGASDPRATRVYFSYKSKAGMMGQYDKVLCYDYGLDRWSLILGWGGQYMATLAVPGTTLEGLDSIAGAGGIDGLTFSLDDVALSSLLQISIMDTSNQLNFCSGLPMTAIFDTSEQQADNGRRARIRGFRPDTDAANVIGAVGTRENLQLPVVYSAGQVVNSKGLVPTNVSTRLARARVTIPAGATWTFAQGVEPLFSPEGLR